MNRTRRRPEPVKLKLETPPNLPPMIEAATVEPLTADASHTLFAPLHYETGYAYPLIVWLHGAEADERQLVRIMPSVSMRNYVAVAPRGAVIGQNDQGCAVYGWQQTDEHIQLAEQVVFECVRLAAQKLHIARHRVFLAGFDCGGTMAFRVAMNHPEQFAGVLSLGGAFPDGGNPFRNLHSARRLPIFLAAGRHSLQYPSQRVCEDLRLFHAAGLSITLREYPCGHELSPQMLSDVDRWIIEQITTVDRAPAEV